MSVCLSFECQNERNEGKKKREKWRGREGEGKRHEIPKKKIHSKSRTRRGFRLLDIYTV